MLKLLQRKLLKMFTVVALLLSVNAMWGQYSGVGTFTKITSLNDLSDGYYVIAYSASQAMNGTNSGGNSYFGNTGITVTNNNITNPSTAIVWKIQTNGGSKTIYHDATAKYASYKVSLTNGAGATSPATVGNDELWSFAYVSNQFQIQSVSVSGRYLQYNTGSPRFACYTGGQQYLTLYKLASTTPTLTPNPTALADFSYIEGATSSTSQSFALTGSNLTSATNGSITISATGTNYEVSSDNTTFGATATKTYSGTSLASTNVYVRLKLGLAVGSYNSETITISGGGATTNPTVTVSGNVLTSNVAPVASNVTVTGTYRVAQVLSGTFTYTDADNDAQGTHTYKWYRANDINGTGSAAITNATSSSYTLVTADAGKYIRLGVTPVAATGTSPGIEKYSAWSGAVVTNVPVLAITGSTNAHGTVCVGTLATTIQYTITNSGGVAATGLGVVSNNPTEFIVSDLSSTSIAAGGTATYNVTFKPGTGGARTGTVTVSASSGNAPTSSLTGTGTAAVVPTVTAGTVSPITTTTATIAGTATVTNCSTAVTAYGVEYSTTSGFSNGTGIVANGSSISGTTITTNLTQLNASTTYYYKVFAQNETGKAYSAQGSFTTTCAPMTLPITEGFEGTAFPPACWTKFRGTNNLGPDQDWVRTTSNTYNTSAGAATVRYESVTGSQLAEDWLVTPALILPATGNLIKLKYFERQGLTSDYNTQFYVKISTTSQNTISAFNNIINYGESAFGTEYTERIIDLSAFAGQTVYIAFVMSQNNGDSWFIDNVSVQEELNAPVAINATNISPSGFTANWNAVNTATGYNFDIATTSGFDSVILGENFSGFNGSGNTNRESSLNTYMQTTGWTGTNVYENTGYARIGISGTSGNLTSPTINLSGNNGVANVSLRLSRFSNDTGTVVQVLHAADGVTFVQIGANITPPLDWTTFTVNITGGTQNSKIKIQGVNATDNRFYIDDIAVQNSTILLSFNNIATNGTSAVITGLQQNTTYYYRVRANSTIGTSLNSNVIPVTTGKNLVWNTNQWTGNATPRLIDNGTIETAYTTPAAGLTIGNLTVNSGVTVDVPSNTTITLGGTLTNNNATGANFTVRNNGALLQTGTGANTGAITVLKNANPLYRLDYTMWAAPVENQKLIDFSSATALNRFYEYKYATNAQNQNIEGYWSVDASNVFSAAKGYLIRMPNTDNTAGYTGGTATLTFEGKFVGKPHTGNYNITASTAANRFTAVGNPYPSPIGVEEFYAQNSDVLDNGATIFLWRKRNSTTQASSYAKLTRTMFTANGSSADVNGNHTGGQDQGTYFSSGRTFMLAAGQGFIVKTKNGATATDIKFTNSMRKAAPADGQAFLRTAQTPASRLWINIAGPDGGFSQSGLAYLANATTGIDYGYDGKQLIEQGIVSLYSVAEGTALVIQARPEFTTSDVVPMGYNANVAGNFSISIDHTDGLFAAGQNVYLKDKAMGITRNISETDYTFTTEAGTFEDRFELVYTTEALGTDNPVLTADNLIVYKNGESININAGSTRINAVTVFDIRGRKLYSQQNVNNTEAVVSGLTVQSQVLIVEIATEKGIVSKKIIF